MTEIASGNATPAKRRGRRPAGQDTRTALLDAAREAFARSGYEGATVRDIAARAGVDAAMVNHWFGGKEGLFGQAVLKLPFSPAELVRLILDGPEDELAERIVRTFLTRWDGAGGEIFTALVRSVAGHSEATGVLRDVFVRHIFGELVSKVAPDHADLRATLCATQMVGLGISRYVLAFEPLASAEVELLVTAIAPNLQRYLTGDLGDLGDG
ncbi:TetR family transcriptional regulator [Amycolatopsis antarctica]|uniref:TetR family transcriptional regulator n=1 Tax=Amycolatopsis antarctica TaxID=1854586 RepID=A0A263CWG0_9PSEU|nr:TetR family transcriptional regulator [Amycolatopsis antarctica]OZM70473.1 TetR family transcriptional regulator [Amycolatopsis antarctica]